MTLVPPGVSRIRGFSSPLADCSLDRAILVDRYEVSRADWLFYFPEDTELGRGAFPGSPLASLDEGVRQWPAFLDLDQAEELARRRGMRLLTAREWIHAAIGTTIGGDPQAYPWGYEQTSVANTVELGLGVPTAVGSFENGQSPFGCYDMLGNVWEWVAEVAPGFGDDWAFAIKPHDRWIALPGDRITSVLGGSYLTPRVRTYGPRLRSSGPALRFNAKVVGAGLLSPEVGVRMGVDAESYLWQRSREWEDAAGARERLGVVGRRWAELSGRDRVVPVLESLALRPDAPPALGWLLIGARSRP